MCVLALGGVGLVPILQMQADSGWARLGIMKWSNRVTILDTRPCYQRGSPPIQIHLHPSVVSYLSTESPILVESRKTDPFTPCISDLLQYGDAFRVPVDPFGERSGLKYNLPGDRV